MARKIEEEFDKLKPTHKEFITNILNGKSATESYALAFPNASRKTAGVKGHKLKTQYAHIIASSTQTNPDLVRDIAEQTIANLTLMAFADTSLMFDKKGMLKPLSSIPKEIRMSITEIEVKGKKVSYKIGGKLKALEILAKVARLTESQPEVSITIMTEEEKEKRIKEILVQAVRRDADEDD